MVQRIPTAMFIIATMWFCVVGCDNQTPNLAGLLGQFICAETSGDIANGEALFKGLNCANCTVTCFTCHGEPGAPCDSAEEICFPCQHPDDTDMGVKLISLLPGPDDMRERDAAAPFGFVCQGQDIANAVAFLCGSEGRYITNQRITIDGGGF